MFNSFKKYLYLSGFILLFFYSFFSANSASADEMKTLKFFVGQETAQWASGSLVNMPFTVYIGDDISVVKSAFIEVRGVSSPTASLTLDVSIDDPTFSSDREKSHILDSSGKTTPIKILYDVTNYMNIIAPGEYSYTLNLRGTGATVSLWSAKLIISYVFRPPTGGYATSGYLTSSIFDTQITDGAALNSIMWKGYKPPASHVKFQIASSNSSSGPWNYIGPDGTSSTYYEPNNPDTPIEINLAHHNNKRYFKYKVILNPTPNRKQTPRVDDIILNWSP